MDEEGWSGFGEVRMGWDGRGREGQGEGRLTAEDDGAGHVGPIADVGACPAEDGEVEEADGELGDAVEAWVGD